MRCTATVGKVLRGHWGISQIRSHGNQGGLKRGIFDLHRGRVLNGKEPNPARLHKLLNGRIADGPDPKDRVRLSLQKCIFRRLVIFADKLEIRLMETKMFHHAEKRLKLSPALRQSNPLALQIHQGLYLRIS